MNEIKRMINGEPIIKIGHRYYGSDELTTVSSIMFAPETAIRTIRGLRVEAASAFTIDRKPQLTLIVTVVVSYVAFRTHIQEVDAMVRIMPVVPVQGLAIASMIYEQVIPREDIHTVSSITENNYKNLAMLRIGMHIDSMNIQTLDEAPRDLKIEFTMTPVRYNDVYLVSYDDAVNQHSILSAINTVRGDNTTIDAIATMVGVDTTKYQKMLTMMKNKGMSLPITNSNVIYQSQTETSILVSYDSMTMDSRGLFTIADEIGSHSIAIEFVSPSYHINPKIKKGDICLITFPVTNNKNSSGAYVATKAMVIEPPMKFYVLPLKTIIKESKELFPVFISQNEL
jgi:hypothetical protein